MEVVMWADFRKFIARGNVMDMAVGVIIGAAFGTVVKSLVDDVIMPPIGKLTGGVDFSNLFVNLGTGSYATLEEAKKAGAATINYGLFLNNVITFLIVAFAVFMLVRAYSSLREKPAEPAASTDKECPFCRMRVPLGATRCGHCTSDLTPARV
jgi:large conductance mechanosensitive channel